MKSLIHVLLLSGSAMVMAAPSVPGKPATGHPLIGKWQWTLKHSGCTEVYDFRADGSAPVTSGSERTDNVYSVDSQPDPNGFYRMTIRTTKDYGGKDCGEDESDSTGMETTNFLIFHKNGKMHLVCREAKLDRCMGPLMRVEEK